MDMDYRSIDSEIIETLNFLRPPVKRGYRNSQEDNSSYVIGDNLDLIRDYTEIYKTEEKKTHRIKRVAKSSLSLILQKTCKKQNLEKYSYFNKKSLHNIQNNKTGETICGVENKPIIKVTIIPKTNQKESFLKLLSKHKQYTEVAKIKSPDDKNAIQTKNVFLIVAGSTQEKVYEIKTTGNDKLSKDNDEGDIIKEVHDNRWQIEYREMDKKKKKPQKGRREVTYCNRKNDEIEYTNGSPRFLSSNTKDNHIQGSSRVRIVGRIGLNEDDNYVMNCAATVNGQPVPTEYSQLIKNMLPGTLPDGESFKTTKESQGTQVDIEVQVTKPYQISQMIQCDSCDMYKGRGCNTEEENVNTLKPTNSPLVIISVYPKQEVNNYQVSKLDTLNKFGMPNIESDRDNRNEKIRQMFSVETEVQKSRIPSTTRANLREDSKKNNTNNKTTSTKTNKANRPASPFSRAPRSKVQGRMKPIISETFKPPFKTTQRDLSPFRFYDRKQKNDLDESKPSKGVTVNNKLEKRKQKITRLKSPTRESCDKGVNTIKMTKLAGDRNTKKAIAKKKKDVTTKNEPIVNKTGPKPIFPNNDVSKVSVSIDGKDEYYDVILEKGKFTTDLVVRQGMKENASQKYFEENFEREFEDLEDNSDNKSDSLENFFPIEMTGRHRRSVSQAFNADTAEDNPIIAHLSRINVRDSLEINHRREENSQANKRACGWNNEDDDGEILAPIKHFNGDDCTIADPIKRDREIRKLLGIENKPYRGYVRVEKNNNINVDLEHKVFSHGHPISSHWFFHSTCSCKSSYAKVMVRKACSVPSRTNMEMAMAGQPDTINKDPEEDEDDPTDEEEQNRIEIDLCTKSRETGTYYLEKSRPNEKDRNEKIRISNMINHGTQYEETSKYYDNRFDCTALLKPSENNHNIKDFGNIETNAKQKAILLSRKQYKKVRKTIHKASEKRPKIIWNSSMISCGNDKIKTKSDCLIHWDKEAQTEPSFNIEKVQNTIKQKMEDLNDTEKKQDTVVLFTRSKNIVKEEQKINVEVKKIASTVELRHACTMAVREVACSFTNFGSFGSSNQERKKHNSIETLFRGHRKSHTPNLGLSALSLLSEDMKSKSGKSISPDLKSKRPFLRRLMSCLVMRSKVSEVKVAGSKPHPPTMNSSVDSYHISTSLGALEMSSSVYDTSASFYSNHTIGPVHKMKRSFFSSVREFLAPRKS